MLDMMAAEWLKLRSVRSTYYAVAVACVSVVLAAALAWYAAVTWDGMTPVQRAHFAVSPLPDVSGWVAALSMAVLGVLVITSEYATGMIRATLAATPRRLTVLAAKTAIVAAVALVAGQAVVFGTYAAGRLIIGDRPIRGQEPMDTSLLLAMGLSVVMFALIGLGLGATMRSAAGAITAVVALWWVAPIFANNVPAPWNDRIGSLLPGALAGQLAGTGNPHSIYGAPLLPPWGAFAVMVAYVAVPLGVATVLLARRDA